MFAKTQQRQERPSIEHLLDLYFEQMPRYQSVPLESLTWRRVLFGGFPCYSDAPLRPGFDRILQIGDAGACQSPLSFGGFGTMVRHLPRLSEGIFEAVQGDRLSREELRLLAPYLPSLSAAWLFQRSMGFKIGQMMQGGEEEETSAILSASSSSPSARGEGSASAADGPASTSGTGRNSGRGFLPPGHINRVLRCNFSAMRMFGDRVLRPFLQDTLQFGPLTLAMWGMMFKDPLVIIRVFAQVITSMKCRHGMHFSCVTRRVF
jgi:hypothetical protein